ncbi:hypothetical protein CsSME_00008454 [Camellia sinensis var. sinensis]
MLAKVNQTRWTLLSWHHLPSHTDRLLTHLQTPPPSSLKKQTPGQRRRREVALMESRKRSLLDHRCLRTVFNHLSKAVEAQKHLTVRHGTGASQKYGIEPCMQWLMAIPNFISTPLFHFACTALENTDYREILMCMPDDENVVGWLAAVQVSKGL